MWVRWGQPKATAPPGAAERQLIKVVLAFREEVTAEWSLCPSCWLEPAGHCPEARDAERLRREWTSSW
jgi:hypothetical protein